MKKKLIGFIYTSIILFLFFSISDTSAKKESITKYTTLHKENQIVDQEEKNEIIEEETQTKDVKNDIVKTNKKSHKKEIKVKEKNTNTNTENKDEIITEVSNDNIKKQTKTKSTSKIKYGTFGRLYINGHSVALYDYNVNTKSDIELQTIVDNKDSAAYYRNYGKLVIADHYNQGFKSIVDLTEGTMSYIKFENGDVIKYKLIKKFKGYNDGHDLKDLDNNSVFDMTSDVIMYTCYDNGIMVTLWSLS